MEITLDQYIVNPMGIKNSVYSNKEMYRQLYVEKLDKILVREVGNVKYSLFYDKDGSYYILMKIPSEVLKDFYYDTVIMFYTNDETIRLQRTLKNYFVKFYSNDPSFVYTFAHAMLKNDLFIRDLVPRMSKEAVQKVAAQKNPKSEVGYVKSLYFEYLLITNYNLLQKIKFESEGKPYDKKSFLALITHADIKVQDRQVKGEELGKQKRLEKEKAKRDKIHNDNFNRTVSHRINGPNTNNDLMIKKTRTTSIIGRSTIDHNISIKKTKITSKIKNK